MDFDPVADIMLAIGTFGLTGLFAIALAERFLPVIPSYGMLLAVGIGAAEGAWSLPAALLAVTLGSFAGWAACYYMVRLLGAERALAVVFRAARLFGMPARRLRRSIGTFRRNQTMLAFVLQLVPTVRLFVPAFAGMLVASPRGVLAASAAGIATWNSLFTGIGFYVSHATEAENTTMLALAALGLLLATQAVMLWLFRRAKPRRMRIAR